MSNEISDRQRRLAEALRANLRRRKGQARAQTGGEGANEAPEQEEAGRRDVEPE